MSSLSTLLKAPGALIECDDDPEAVLEYKIGRAHV